MIALTTSTMLGPVSACALDETEMPPVVTAMATEPVCANPSLLHGPPLTCQSTPELAMGIDIRADGTVKAVVAILPNDAATQACLNDTVGKNIYAPMRLCGGRSVPSWHVEVLAQPIVVDRPTESAPRRTTR